MLFVLIVIFFYGAMVIIYRFWIYLSALKRNQYGNNKTKKMQILSSAEFQPTLFKSPSVKGVKAYYITASSDASNEKKMRIYEISPGGISPRHSHKWEHDWFLHAGEAEIYFDGKWATAKKGSIIFIPGGMEHQIRNSAKELLIIVSPLPQ